MVNPVTQFFESSGRTALMKNVRDHPRILIGDPEFDALSEVIFERILAQDPRVLKWDDEFVATVGLYDQATRGDIPKSQRCEEPNFDSFTAKVKMGSQIMMDGGKKVIDQFRRSAHTKQVGKPREQAIEEFKELVMAMYRANQEKAPGDISLNIPSANGIESGTLEESEDGSYSGTIEYYTPSEGSQGSESVEGQSQGRLLTGPVTSGDSHVRHLLEGAPRVGAGGTGYHQAPKIIPESSAIPSTGEPKMFSKEWWTPGKGVIVAAAAGAGISLLAGGIFLFNKMFTIRRKTRDGGKGGTRRLHAREWKRDEN